MMGKSEATLRETCHNDILAIKYPTWTGLELNLVILMKFGNITPLLLYL